MTITIVYLQCSDDTDTLLYGSRWDRVSPLAKQFIRRLLVKDGTKRMTAQEALQHVSH